MNPAAVPTTLSDRIRVAGRLTADARLVPSTGAMPHAFLFLDWAPAQGLPYRARVDLGADLADHMATEALLPQLRAGAVVSVAGTALRLRTDHDVTVLSVIDARDVLVLADPVFTTHPANAEDTHAH